MPTLCLWCAKSSCDCDGEALRRQLAESTVVVVLVERPTGLTPAGFALELEDRIHDLDKRHRHPVVGYGGYVEMRQSKATGSRLNHMEYGDIRSILFALALAPCFTPGPVLIGAQLDAWMETGEVQTWPAKPEGA